MSEETDVDGRQDSEAGEDPPVPVRVRTMGDLARIAKVSPGTVSRALSGSDLVNEKTRERIQNLARELGFRPNQMASKLRTQRTGVIGVAIPLGHDRRQQISDTFFMTLLGYLADELSERHYDLMLSRVIPDREDDWIDRVTGSGMMDGVIIIGQSDQFEVIEAAARNYLPLVVWGNHQPGQTHCVVGSDNFRGGQMAAEHLLDRGATSLAFFGDTSAIEFKARFEGFSDVAKTRKVPFVALPTHLSPDRMRREISTHFDANPGGFDGIFTATDGIALECLRELRLRKISVPDKMKVIGFDDLPVASQSLPPLTTIRQDIEVGARTMVDILMRRLGGENVASFVMNPILVIRETT